MKLHLPLLAALLATGGISQATVIQLQFEGTGGLGLLPTNENGTGAEVLGASTASGSILAAGLSYDDVTQILDLNFTFAGLTTGFNEDAAGGLHIHGPATFVQNAAIEINLATSSDFNLVINADDISGTLTGSTVLTDAQESDLLAGLYYVNIHSDEFGNGELRGNLTSVVPEPTTAGLSLLSLLLMARRRR